MEFYTLPLEAFAYALGLYALSLKFFPKWGLLDFPERYGHQRSPIPYPTGIIAVVVFSILLLTRDVSTQTLGILSAVWILAVVSFLDDRKSVSPSIRLAAQLICAFLVFATGTRIYTITNPLEGFLGFSELVKLDTLDIMTVGFGPLPFWSGVFTLFWIGLTINALNWFDGIPGQVSILSFIGFTTIGLLSISDRVDQPELAILAFCLAGIALAGLVFDFPPAKVLMGDTGAMFFGLMLGVLTIHSGGKLATAFLVLGVPLIDSFLVIAQRIIKGASPTRGNAKNEHLHHRLLRKGWSERQIILLTAGLGSLFGITALFLSTSEKFISIIILFCLMVGLNRYSCTKK